MSVRVNLLPLVKMSFFAMLLYSSFLMEAMGVKISNMTLMLGMLTAMFTFLDMLNDTCGIITVTTKDVKLLLLFLLMSILSVPFSVYPTTAVNGIIQLVENILLMAITIYICIREGSVRFCARTIVVVMAAATFYALNNASDFDVRLTLTEDSNANVFGHNAVLGFGLAAIAFDAKKKLNKVLILGLYVLFAIGVVLSASRMSFIALLGYIAIFLIYYVPKNKQDSVLLGGIRMLLGLIAAAGLIALIMPYMQGTLIAERMESLLDVYNTGDGDGAARIYLYEAAWKAFLKHPVLGLGYANFAPLHYGVYTHSTYAEILSCTGIFGASVFLSYYLHMWKELKIGASRAGENNQRTTRLLILLFVALLLLGVGEILIYKIKYFIVYGIFSAQFWLNKHAEAVQS